MKYCIHKSVLGTDAHLMIDGGFVWVDNIPENCWVLGCKSSVRSLDKIAELFHEEIPSFASLPQAKFLLSLGLEPQDVSWQKAITSQAYKDTINGLIEGCGKVVESFQKSGYENTFLKNQEFLSRLQGSRVNKKELAMALGQETGPGQISNLNSFKPSADGFCKPVVYDTVGTSTGRMRVVDGPRILTLKKEYRSVVASRFEKGEIVSIDYSSLEPRIALALHGHQPTGDVYRWIDDEIFDGNLGRSTAKILTLSLIYGMSIHSAGRKYGKITSKQKQKLRTIFGIDAIEKLVASAEQPTNAFGRPIYPDSEHKHFNSYIQSTAVDAAIQGFSKIDDMGCREAIPLFMIHDELVCDVPEGYSNFMRHILSNGIEVELQGKTVRLDVKVESFSERD